MDWLSEWKASHLVVWWCNQSPLYDSLWKELVPAAHARGSGGFDVIETKGLGPATEYLQRRISYRRLNVVPWTYEDTYFLDRIDQKGLTHRADNLILARQNDRYAADGRFRTRLLVPPGDCRFVELTYRADIPEGSSLMVNAIDERGNILKEGCASGSALGLARPIRIEFRF